MANDSTSKTFVCQIPDTSGMELTAAVRNMSQGGRYSQWCTATATLENEKLLIDYQNEFGQSKRALDFPLAKIKRVTIDVVTRAERLRRLFKKYIIIGAVIGVLMSIGVFIVSGDNLDMGMFVLVAPALVCFGVVLSLVLSYLPKRSKIEENISEFQFWHSDTSFFPVYISSFEEPKTIRFLKEVHLEPQKCEPGSTES